MISIIVAMTHHHVIGLNNQLPWHLPADLKHFKAITMGKPIIMGRKTYESIGNPLPGRRNIIITNNPAYRVIGAETTQTLEDAIAMAMPAQEIMIIGGAQIFAKSINIVDRIYLTLVDAEIDGDTFFPKIDDSVWKIIDKEKHLADANNPFNYEFLVLERVTKHAHHCN